MGFPEWRDRLPREEAAGVCKSAKFVSDGGHVKDCFWRGYRLGDRCFIGLSGSSDIWETDEETMLDNCED